MKGLGFKAVLLLISWAACGSAPASASETITYSYDPQGRLIAATHSGTINNNLQSVYQLDNADNRTTSTVTGVSPRVVVVPLNGFTVIPINGP